MREAIPRRENLNLKLEVKSQSCLNMDTRLSPFTPASTPILKPAP
jgi:hypothetical protein